MSVPSESIHWNQYAQDYTLLTKLRPYHDLQLFIADIVNQFRPCTTTLLDLGCGVGNLWSYLRDLDDLEITAFDSSSEMLHIAQSRVGSRAITTSVMDLDTPFADSLTKSYDVIVSSNMLYTLAQKDLFLSQCCAALSPSGILILVDPRPDMENGLVLKSHCNSQKPDSYWYDMHDSSEREKSLLQEALADEPHLLSGMLRIAKHNRDINASHFDFCCVQQLQAKVIQSGFKIDSVTSVYANQATCIVASKSSESL